MAADTDAMVQPIHTKGTGAGGSRTNSNGLPYEALTELSTEYEIKSTHKHHSVIQFYQRCESSHCSQSTGKVFIFTKQGGFLKYIHNKIDHTIPPAHGCKRPDECYIDEERKIIFIIEKKFQQVPGSVCEKIQTSDFKKWHYSRLIPDYEIVYIYCLSDWFRANCKAELAYLAMINVPIFWGGGDDYKSKIIDFITSY